MRVLRPGEAVTFAEASEVDELLASLSLTKPLACQSIRAREHEFLPRLEVATDASEILAVLRGTGAEARDADKLAAALGSATAIAEIVAVDDEQHVLPGAVAVFCSPRGDVVSIPSVAADGGRWLTLAPATRRRISLACVDLA